MITIARRLKTVIDADRIMVMDNGKIKELDPPHLLLQNEKGIFFNLVKQVRVCTSCGVTAPQPYFMTNICYDSVDFFAFLVNCCLSV